MQVGRAAKRTGRNDRSTTETACMRSFIFYFMIVLMIAWTAVFIMELAYVYFSSTAVARPRTWSRGNRARGYVGDPSGAAGTP